MTEIVFSIIVFTAFTVSLVAPVLLGMQLTRFRPNWSPWLVTGLSALPTGLPFLAFAAWLAVTADITPCANPPCGNMAPLWFDVMLFLGLFMLLVGFGLAWLGRVAERRRSR